VLKEPLDPWQEWLVIHAGELLPDGTPRFRQVLVLVARQNGKTHVLKVLSLFWLYIERVGLVLGTSTNLDYAKESWEKAVTLAEDTPALTREIKSVRRANGEQTLTVAGNGRYKIAASNRRGGRSLTVNRLIMDELREHHDWSAYSAAEPATSAVPDAQIFMISNAGDATSVVLNSLRAQALLGEDTRLGLFEWSALDNAEATDVAALAAANPNLGRRISLEPLMGKAVRAQAAGGEQLTSFLTEHHCRNVPILNPAIDATGWQACLDADTLDAVKGRVALCLDVSPDLRHATLYASGLLDDGRARVEPIAAWSGQACTDQLRRELPDLISKVKPAKIGWFPSGPAAALAADMKEHDGWPPDGVEVDEIRGEVTAVCMGFAEQVTAAKVAHSGDPLLDAHIAGAEKLTQGDGWRFSRKGAGMSTRSMRRPVRCTWRARYGFLGRRIFPSGNAGKSHLAARLFGKRAGLAERRRAVPQQPLRDVRP
jgi:hypothetical protein